MLGSASEVVPAWPLLRCSAFCTSSANRVRRRLTNRSVSPARARAFPFLEPSSSAPASFFILHTPPPQGCKPGGLGASGVIRQLLKHSSSSFISASLMVVDADGAAVVARGAGTSETSVRSVEGLSAGSTAMAPSTSSWSGSGLRLPATSPMPRAARDRRSGRSQRNSCIAAATQAWRPSSSRRRYVCGWPRGCPGGRP